MTALELIRAGFPEACRPWPRFSLLPAEWAALAARLAEDPAPVLLGLWADTQQVHALFRDRDGALIASVAVEGGRYPALSTARPVASRFERMIRDLWGHAATGAGDERTWLDHGRWPLAHPLSPRPGLPGGTVEPPAFGVAEEQGVMQVPIGPVHGLIEEPAHLRLVARGHTVLRAEARLGYAHRGILALMRGKSPRTAARFVARLAAESTVAHSVAFARATEAALDTPAPLRAATVRVVMLLQERVAGHLDDLARLADAAGLVQLDAALGQQREFLLRAAEQAFGHRLMMDVVMPGGLAADIASGGAAAIGEACDALEAALPLLRRRLDPLLGRLDGVGVIPAAAAADSNRAGDRVHRHPGESGDVNHMGPRLCGDDGGAAPSADGHASKPPATSKSPGTGANPVPLRLLRSVTGDAAARCRARLTEIDGSLERLRDALDGLPEGPISATLPADSGEGLASAGSVRGTIWHWLRLDHGQIADAFPCDPGWMLWPLAEAAIANGPAEEETMIRLSCGLPCAALDL